MRAIQQLANERKQQQSNVQSGVQGGEREDPPKDKDEPIQPPMEDITRKGPQQQASTYANAAAKAALNSDVVVQLVQPSFKPLRVRTSNALLSEKLAVSKPSAVNPIHMERIEDGNETTVIIPFNSFTTSRAQLARMTNDHVSDMRRLGNNEYTLEWSAGRDQNNSMIYFVRKFTGGVPLGSGQVRLINDRTNKPAFYICNMLYGKVSSALLYLPHEQVEHVENLAKGSSIPETIQNAYFFEIGTSLPFVGVGNYNTAKPDNKGVAFALGQFANNETREKTFRAARLKHISVYSKDTSYSECGIVGAFRNPHDLFGQTRDEFNMMDNILRTIVDEVNQPDTYNQAILDSMQKVKLDFWKPILGIRLVAPKQGYV
jgi:hypothetical protein